MIHVPVEYSILINAHEILNILRSNTIMLTIQQLRDNAIFSAFIFLAVKTGQRLPFIG